MGGQIVLARTEQGWLAGVVFGSEIPDSDMATGASYGLGLTPEDALCSAAGNLGRRRA